MQVNQKKNLTKDDTNKVQTNVGMTQQYWNKNLTKDDINKVQKNVGRTQQCQNKNLTKDDTNKVQKNVGMHNSVTIKISQMMIQTKFIKMQV